MKNTLAIVMAVLILSACLGGCGTKKDNPDSDKLQIVSTIFPSYDFARQICAEDAEITMLLPPGSESHSYEPTPQDIITIQNCDLFIYVGGESDTWVDDILNSMDKPVKTLRMMDCVTVVQEELKEGMEEETEDAEGEAENAEEVEYDEHVWTSPKNAANITKAISAAVCELDSENTDTYSENTEAYVTKLNNLDEEFTSFFAALENKTIIVGDRFPLRYFTDEYGLDYYAAFPGCSTETEPSAATIAFLIDKVEDENISTVFYIEFSNHLVADSIAEATGAKTALFQTCHNVSEDDLNSGATYVSIMEQNLATLKEVMQ